MAKKKGEQLRFSCEFCCLNKVIIKDACPIPRIDESSQNLAMPSFSFNWIWVLPSGRFLLRKKDREKTGFACELGFYQWKKMPFG